MKIPDNFEELNKLFKASAEDAPVDFAEFLEEPIADMVLRLGRSVWRLTKLVALSKSEYYVGGVLDSFVSDFFSMSRKYISVLKARRGEFVEYIQKIDTSKMPDYLIMENLPAICAAVAQAIDAEGVEDDFDPNEPQPGE